ncbi:MAG: hypothetical protein ACKVJU_24350 [Verrucomicrobiales bacterium]
MIVNAHVEPKYGKPIPVQKVPGTAGSLAQEIAKARLVCAVVRKERNR